MRVFELVSDLDVLSRLRSDARSGLLLRSWLRPVRSLGARFACLDDLCAFRACLVACPEIVFLGRPKVKFLLPMERGRVLVQVIHDAFVRSVRWKRVAQSGEQLLQNLFVELPIHLVVDFPHFGYFQVY